MAKPPPRIFVSDRLTPGSVLALGDKHAHYLAQVLRLKAGAHIVVFNGRDGEWLGELIPSSAKNLSIRLSKQQREQQSSPDHWLVFAPVKQMSEQIIRQAAELGTREIHAVFTKRCVISSVREDKLGLQLIEAAEQCERLDVPSLHVHKDMSQLLGAWPRDRMLLAGDETGGGAPLGEVLTSIEPGTKCAVLIGPEGGFTADERQLLRAMDFVKFFSMGPRILRADTAAVTALGCLMQARGDWHLRPHFADG